MISCRNSTLTNGILWLRFSSIGKYRQSKEPVFFSPSRFTRKSFKELNGNNFFASDYAVSIVVIVFSKDSFILLLE